MKLKRLVALLSAGLLIFAVSPFSVVASDESFYQEVAAMLQQDNFENYFGSLQLNLGTGTYYVDGEKHTVDPILGILQNDALTLLKALTETAGIQMDYNILLQRITLTTAYGNVISYTLNDDHIVVDGQNLSFSDIKAAGTEGAAALIEAVADQLGMEAHLNPDGNIEVTAPYQTCRLLVCTNSLEPGTLNAVNTITDGNGLWILEFANPVLTKLAEEALQLIDGIIAEPDLYVPPIRDMISSRTQRADDGLSWGVSACHFREYVQTNQTRMSKRAIVAVADTGVDTYHPHLAGHMLTGYNVFEYSSNVMDFSGHGTHVAGTVIDCAGTAPVDILPIKVFIDDGGTTDSAIIAGIEYAYEHGADVINLSLGGPRDPSASNGDALDYAISKAIDRGTVIVIAAGNSNVDTYGICPAHLMTPGTIVVGAANELGQASDFSNKGQSIDISAPGEDIYSSLPGGVYGAYTGTSMAAPHVSAAAALIDLSYEKKLSPAQIEQKTKEATMYGQWVNAREGYGFLNLMKAEAAPATGKESTLPFNDRDEIQHKEAVGSLVRRGVIEGLPDGRFHPTKILSRAEACTIITRLEGTPVDRNWAGSHSFTDTAGHWAEAYIEYCVSRGIINGYGDGRFGPDDSLTVAAWEKMLLVSMGYEAQNYGMTGRNWLEAVSALVNQVNLERQTTGLKQEDYINRDETCQIAYNAAI